MLLVVSSISVLICPRSPRFYTISQQQVHGVRETLRCGINLVDLAATYESHSRTHSFKSIFYNAILAYIFIAPK